MFAIIIFFLFASIPIALHAEEKKHDEKLSIAMEKAESILKEIENGSNLQVFDKKFVLSGSNNYLKIEEDNSFDQQMLFDAILSKLSTSQDERQLIGGGFLAIELNTKIGKKKNNELKLVEYLAELLNLDKTDCQIFSIKALSSDYFKDASVFSPNSRQLIYQKIKEDPSITDLLGSDIVTADNNILMVVAKIGKTSESIKLLRDIQKENDLKSLICSAALSKMDIYEEQVALIDHFKNTTDLQKKHDIAYALSLWGSRAAQVALAEALRTDGHVTFNGKRPQEMIRLHIAIALVRTIKNDKDELPSRGAFSWKEEDFIKIENWAVNHLGTKWDVPRPKYEAVKKVPF
jgi:hypothetical protein